jgi:hypothetical protein
MPVRYSFLEKRPLFALHLDELDLAPRELLYLQQ